jgi:hypothetical protein
MANGKRAAKAPPKGSSKGPVKAPVKEPPKEPPPVAAAVAAAKPPRRVNLSFDHEEAKGEVGLVRGCYGPDLVVDGRALGYVDLFYRTAKSADEPLAGCVQLVVDGEGGDEPLCKVVLEPGGRVVVVVSRAARVVPEGDAQAFNHRGDWVFVSAPGAKGGD